MKSVVVKRTVIVQGHKTSVNLEHAFWRGLKEVAAWRDMTLSDLLNSIDSERHDEDLSSAIERTRRKKNSSRPPGAGPSGGGEGPLRVLARA